MSNTYERHMAAIISGKVDRTNIIGIRKALNHVARISRGWPGNRCNVTIEQADNLLDAIHKHHPRVTGDLHESGLAVLRNRRYAKRWIDRQSDIIANLERFHLISYDMPGMYATPIYRAIAANGDSFTFINVPWQSGGNGPEIISG